MEEKDDSPKIVPVAGDDEKMIEAINAARKSLKQFLEAFFSPKSNQKSFLLKVVFEDQGEVEHIWLSDLDLMSEPPTGVVANEPVIQTVNFMQRVPFEASNITDWMYYEDECLVGGFTTRVLRHQSRPN